MSGDPPSKTSSAGASRTPQAATHRAAAAETGFAESRWPAAREGGRIPGEPRHAPKHMLVNPAFQRLRFGAFLRIFLPVYLGAQIGLRLLQPRECVRRE